MHRVLNNRLCQRFGTAWLSYQEEWDPEFNTDSHHEHILPQGSILSNVRAKHHFVQQTLLTPADKSHLQISLVSTFQFPYNFR